MRRKYDFQFGASSGPRSRRRDDYDRRRPLRQAGRRAREAMIVGQHNRALAEHTRSRSALQAASIKATEYAAQQEADRELQRKKADRELQREEADRELQREVAEMRLRGVLDKPQRPQAEYHGTTPEDRSAGRDMKFLGEIGSEIAELERDLLYASSAADPKKLEIIRKRITELTRVEAIIKKRLGLSQQPTGTQPQTRVMTPELAAQYLQQHGDRAAAEAAARRDGYSW